MRSNLQLITLLHLLHLFGCSQSESDALREFCSCRETMPENYGRPPFGLISWVNERVTNEDMLARINRALDETDGAIGIQNMQELLDAHGVENCSELRHLQRQQVLEDARPPHDDSYILESLRRDD